MESAKALLDFLNEEAKNVAMARGLHGELSFCLVPYTAEAQNWAESEVRVQTDGIQENDLTHNSTKGIVEAISKSPDAYLSFGRWEQSLYGRHHMYALRRPGGCSVNEGLFAKLVAFISLTNGSKDDELFILSLLKEKLSMWTAQQKINLIAV